ncbi:sialidase family protein [Brachyspira pilosicoli]|uniref:sialidase family protein n=1 Tax=Brachyspira pilosicoli TaxID=52584 RepID=UPI0012F51506|nr:sialidase family protein [Brachyspira pilosicoli]
MSKKIIYLLSLLMALSLVFASCKKNSSVTGGDVPSDEPDTTPPPTDLSGGLFDTQEKLDQYKDKPVQASQVAKYENKNYMRNPVITVIDGQTVLIVYEVRYQTPGAGNDVALTGTNTVDIAYMISTDAGVSFDTSAAIAGYVGGKKATGATDSHGAPIVFYDKQNSKIVVVASAGIGLSSGTSGNGESKLEYSVADISGSTITGFGAWQPIDNIEKGSFSQFGTHSARGTVVNGKLLLPVTLVTYNTQNMNNSTFGYILYEGAAASSGTVSWTKKGSSAVTMPNGAKETRIPKGTSSSDYVALAVPAGNSKLYQGAGSSQPTLTDIQAGDGSAGTLVVKDWKGAASYNPADYAKTFDNNGSVQQSIVSHVLTTEANLAVRLVDTDFKSQTGNSFALGDSYARNSKSSSIDILKDGTIVMVAEGGKVDTGVSSQTFYLFFNRYTQAYLTSKTGSAQ